MLFRSSVVDSAQASLEAAILSAGASAESAFLAVLKAQASLEAAEANLAASELRLSLAAAKAAAGAAAQADRLQAEAETAGSRSVLFRARQAVASARATLASMTGLPPDVSLEPVGLDRYSEISSQIAGLDAAGVQIALDLLLANAVATNPSIAAAGAAVRKADAALAAAEAGRMPVISAGFNHTASWAPGDALSVGSGSVSLTVGYNLDQWKVTNAIETAVSSGTDAAAHRDEVYRQLTLDLKLALDGVIGSSLVMESSEKALEYATSAYENAVERYRLSVVPASDLSAAEAVAGSARTSLIEARFDMYQSLTALARLAGFADPQTMARALAISR